MEQKKFAMEKHDLVQYWKASGLVKDEQVIDAFLSIPREDFIMKEYRHLAYADHPLPTKQSQTISQPSTIMFMLDKLQIKPNHKILEIGTGTGYHAALMGYLASKGKVYTIEIIEELANEAKGRIKRLGLKNVEVMQGDGSIGLPNHAPFDRIIVTAAASHVPQPLLDQLKPGGRMVIPVGDYAQELVLITKSQDGKLHYKNAKNITSKTRQVF